MTDIRTARACLWLAGVLALGLPSAQAQQELSEMSLEELLNVRITSVSKKEQKLFRTPAAVFVITQEDIRRSGATNIPDLLMLAPGVQVARIDANAWAVSIRGFNNRYSNKVLVLVDGRSVYSPTFSGVYWDQQDLPLEDIDRIEVIRGPGGTVWGANAVNGVINIITKPAKETQGGLVTALAGSEDQPQGTLQYGGPAGAAGSYRVFGHYSRTANSVLPNEAEAADGWRQISGGFRADFDLSPRDALTLDGSAFSNSEGQTRWIGFPSGAPLQDAFPDSITARGGDLQAQWDHTYAGGSESSLQVYGDGYRRVNQGAPETLRAFDAAFQHHLAAGSRQDIVWGLEYRVARDALNSRLLAFAPPDRTDNLYSAFVQDEIRLTDSLSLTAGSKFEHNDYTGFEYEPSVSLDWTPSQSQTVWASAARAIRQPSRLEADMNSYVGMIPLGGGGAAQIMLYGDAASQSERLLDYEAGYRRRWGNRLSLDLAFFASFYQRLATVEAPTGLLAPGPPFFLPIYALTYSNQAHARDYGAELFATWNLTPRWRLIPGYSYIEMNCQRDPGSRDLTGYLTWGDAPKHMFQIRSQFNLTRNIEFDSALYYFSHLPLNNIPARVRLDTRLGWRAGERLEFSLVGQNLLRPRAYEFGDAFGVVGTQLERSVYAKITWRF